MSSDDNESGSGRAGQRKRRAVQDADALRVELEEEREKKRGFEEAYVERTARLKAGLQFMTGERARLDARVRELEAKNADLDAQNRVYKAREEEMDRRRGRGQSPPQPMDEEKGGTHSSASNLADDDDDDDDDVVLIMDSDEGDDGAEAPSVEGRRQQGEPEEGEEGGERVRQLLRQNATLQQDVDRLTAALQRLAEADTEGPGSRSPDDALVLLQARQIEEMEARERVHRATVAEVKRLRAQKARWATLEEENAILRSKVQAAQGDVRDGAALEAEVNGLRESIDAWRACTQPLLVMAGLDAAAATAPTVPLVRQALHALQRSREEAEAARSEVVAQHAEKDASSASLGAQVHRLQAELSAAKEDGATKGKALQRAEKRVAALAKQRDGYRAILDSIDEEDTLDNHDMQRIKRIQELEQALEAAERTVADLSSQSSAASEEQERNARLQQQVAKLESECALLEHKVARGEFNPAHTKVLHFAQNPARAAQAKKREDDAARIRALEAEVARLTATQAAASTASSSSPPPAAAPSSSVSKDLEKRLERQNQVFQRISREFRDSVFELLGYKIDMKGHTNPEFHLRSMYAASKNETLVFQRGAKGRLTLLGTPFATALPAEITSILTRFHQIPAFTSAVTNYLFEQTTIQ